MESLQCACVWLNMCICVLPASVSAAGIAPNITAGPSDSAVIDGMSIILHCETSGAPRPAITWQKGQSPISHLSEKDIHQCLVDLWILMYLRDVG